MRSLISRNIFTGEFRESISMMTPQIVKAKLSSARRGYDIHSTRTLKERRHLLQSFVSILQQYKKTTSELMAVQTGQPITYTEEQIQSVLHLCRFHIKQQSMAPTLLKTTAKKTLIKNMPLGVVCVIGGTMYEVMCTFVPNFLLGNCCVIMGMGMDIDTECSSTIGNIMGKHFEKIMYKAGIECGEYQNIYSDRVEQIIQESVGVMFRGHKENAKKICQVAGRHLKISYAQTHSNNILIVGEGGDLNAVIRALGDTIASGGQSIYSIRKIMVVESVYDQFIVKVNEYVSSMKFSDPLDRKSIVGIDRRQAQSSVRGVIVSKVEKPFRGVYVVNGRQYEENVQMNVLKVYRVRDEKEAIELCGETPNILACSVFMSGQSSVLDQIRCKYGFMNAAPKYVVNGYEWKAFANIKTHYVEK